VKTAAFSELVHKLDPKSLVQIRPEELKSAPSLAVLCGIEWMLTCEFGTVVPHIDQGSELACNECLLERCVASRASCAPLVVTEKPTHA